MPYKDYNNKMNQYMQRRYHERRQMALELLGGVCVGCGSDQELNFDHIDSSTKSFGVSKLWSIALDKFLAEINKCQILCQDCHIKKSKLNNDYRKKNAPLTQR